MAGYIFDNLMEQFYPQDEIRKEVCKCHYCGTGLQEGDEVIEDNWGDCYCDIDCFIESLKEGTDYKYIIIEKE